MSRWTSSRYLWLLGALSGAGMLACADYASEPVELEGDALLQVRFQQKGIEYRPLRGALGPRELEFPPEQKAPQDEVRDLRQAVEASGGHVLIGIKNQDALRTVSTGIVPGITVEDWRDGINALLDADVTITRTMRNIPVVRAVVKAEAIEAILRLPWVDYIEADGSLELTGVVTKGPLSAEMRMTEETSWGIDVIQAPDAWSLGYDGDGVSVWVIDNGGDSLHIHGAGGDWNLTSAYCISFPAYNTCYDPGTSIPGHGVLVHSVAIGPDNGVGWIGVAPGVSSNWMSNAMTAPTEAQRFGNVVATLDTMIGHFGDSVTQNAGAIANMSFRTTGNYVSFGLIVAEAWDQGILMVAGAGNDGATIGYPAKYSDVIAVSGTDEDDNFVGATNPMSGCSGGYSSSGNEVTLSAPFQWDGIGLDGDMDASNNGCGTSFATAAVTGVAAIIWDRFPSFTNEDVRVHLVRSAVDVESLGWDNKTGWGRVDAYRAAYCPEEGCAAGFVLSGPDERDVDQSGTWSVTSLVGGVGPYSYQWYKNDVLQSGQTSSSFTTSFPTASANHTIKVVVTPTFGDTTFEFMYVDTTSCEEEWCG